MIKGETGRTVRPSGVLAVLAALLVAITGTGLSVGAGVALRTVQQRAADEAVSRRMELAGAAVAAESGRYVDTMRMIAASAGTIRPLTRTGFTQAVQPLEKMGLIGATSITFMVAATDEQIPRLRATWRDRGAADLGPGVTDPGHEREYEQQHEHIFPVFNHPLAGFAAPADGAALSPAATQALIEARHSGQVTISDSYVPSRDALLPPHRQQRSFVLAAPVHGPPPAAGSPRPFLGWILMEVRGQDFIGATLQHVTHGSADVRLRAHHSDGTDVTVTTLKAAGDGTRDLRRTGQVRVAQRHWQLELSATSAHLPGTHSALPVIVTGAGVVASALLAALTFALAGSRARARAQVVEATAELRAAEEASSRQAALLSAVLDSVSDGVSVIDEHGAFLLHNPAAKTILGIPSTNDRIGTWQRHYGIFTADGEDPFPTEQLPLVRALAGESAEQVPMMIRNLGHPDGVIISVSARPLDAAAGQAGAVAVFHDITAVREREDKLAATSAALHEELARHEADQAELRATRDELVAQKAYLTQILDAINVSVMTVDTGGRLVHGNRIARAVLPAGDAPTLTEIAAKLDMAYPDDKLMPVEETPLARALRAEKVNAVEALVAVPDGTRRAVMVHAQPLHHDGQIVGAVASAFDITALREREAELAAFAGIVAHDLKRPLAAVRGFAELVHESLSDQVGLDEQVLHLERVVAATWRMSRLIDDLLTYATARDAPLALAPLRLGTLVREVVDEHLAAAAAVPSAPMPQVYIGSLPAIRADAALIRQLVDNLVGNAIKYTPPGRAAHVDVTAHPAGDGWVRLEVTDRGIGIPPSEHQAIFASFHRVATAYSGTGLGLAICQRIAERHGGTIAAGDNPGGGARFSVTLPAA
ncbi:ATP-binding protein [Planobispora rosea]|uniref:ATP-binding protein n=1 Tax=Planobispora rosea TaxID=35762 RepID=UPI00083A2204|nr:ATP-binding protein [Planobispora rosea]